MIRVLLIDDHQLITDSIKNAIKCKADIQVVGTIKDASLGLKLCTELTPDIIITDVCTDNGSSGIVATQEIKKAFPPIKIIVMSGFEEVSYIPSAIEAGADAFISKSRPLNDFVDMIYNVMQGEKHFPSPIQIPTASGHAPFSTRELEVLTLLCKSYKREEIAQELCISVGTVKRHIENMLEKSGCTSAMELAVHVTSNGWITTKQT